MRYAIILLILGCTQPVHPSMPDFRNRVSHEKRGRIETQSVRWIEANGEDHLQYLIDEYARKKPFDERVSPRMMRDRIEAIDQYLEEQRQYYGN